MERKALTLEIKGGDRGQVEAVISKIGEIDHEGDIVLAGAFDDGAEAPIGAYGHASVMFGGAKPPVGKGVIKVDGDLVKLAGAYFMDLPAARDEFLTVKQMGALMGWSYGFDLLERGTLTKEQQARGARRAIAKVRVHEVSPTVVPAGRSTGTVSAKQLEGRKALALDERLGVVFEDPPSEALDDLARLVIMAAAPAAGWVSPTAWACPLPALKWADLGDRSAGRSFSTPSGVAPVVVVSTRLADPEAVVTTALHELRHISAHPHDMDDAAAEADASAFAALHAKAVLDFWRAQTTPVFPAEGAESLGDYHRLNVRAVPLSLIGGGM